MIGTTEEVNSLYQSKKSANHVTKSLLSSCSVVHCSNNVTSKTLWHVKLGHPSYPRLKALQHIDKYIVTSSIYCDVCHYSKKKRFSFPTSTSVSSNCFDLIYMDIWGPMSIASMYGHLYFLTIVEIKVGILGFFQ